MNRSVRNCVGKGLFVGSVSQSVIQNKWSLFSFNLWWGLIFFFFYYSLKSMGTAEYQEPNHRCKSLHPTRIIFIIFDMWLILVSFWKCGFHSISDIMWYLSRRSGTSGWREGSWAAEDCWQGRRRYFTSTFQVLLRCTSTLTPSAATLQSRSANLSLLRGRRQTGLVRRRK